MNFKHFSRQHKLQKWKDRELEVFDGEIINGERQSWDEIRTEKVLPAIHTAEDDADDGVRCLDALHVLLHVESNSSAG
jgi:hypothetical protein